MIHRGGKMSKYNLNDLSAAVVDSAIQVHRALGPGLLESAYEACLVYELRKHALSVQSQVGLPVVYDEVKLEVGYRIDLLVENQIIVELKAIAAIQPIHEAQLLSYLKLSNLKIGLLLNFNVKLMKDGIKRIVNNL
jgi:GxxExxY protein